MEREELYIETAVAVGVVLIIIVGFIMLFSMGAPEAAAESVAGGFGYGG